MAEALPHESTRTRLDLLHEALCEISGLLGGLRGFGPLSTAENEQVGEAFRIARAALDAERIARRQERSEA